MTEDLGMNTLVVEPLGNAYSNPDGCAYSIILEIEQATGVVRKKANRATITSGGAYSSEQAEFSMTNLIKDGLPELIVLIAYEPADTSERLAKNTARLRSFIPFGHEDDPSWPRKVRAFYIYDGEGDSMKWREIMPYPETEEES